VVGLVGVVEGQDGGEGAEIGKRSGVEGVVDVGGDDALERGEVDSIEGRAESNAEDGEDAGLGVKVELAVGVVLAVHGSVEGPHRAVGVASLGRSPDVDGLGEGVGLEVGAQKVFCVDGESKDDGGGDDGADGAFGGDGAGCDGGVFVPVVVAGDAEVGALGGFAFTAVGFVGHAPEVVEDLIVARDKVGRQRPLAVDIGEDGALGSFGSVPAWVRGGVGVGGAGEEHRGAKREQSGEERGGRVSADQGRRGRRRSGGRGSGGRGGGWGGGWAARDVRYRAGSVGREQLAVAADVDGLAVQGVDSAAEPAVAETVDPDLLSHLYERDGGAGVGEGAAQAVGGSVILHDVAGGMYGTDAGGNEGVGVVVVANDGKGLVARHSRGRGGSVGA